MPVSQADMSFKHRKLCEQQLQNWNNSVCRGCRTQGSAWCAGQCTAVDLLPGLPELGLSGQPIRGGAGPPYPACCRRVAKPTRPWRRLSHQATQYADTRRRGFTRVFSSYSAEPGRRPWHQRVPPYSNSTLQRPEAALLLALAVSNWMQTEVKAQESTAIFLAKRIRWEETRA
jgi:hypothetical protein